MPHGTRRLVAIEVTALCDFAPHFPEPFSEAFPTIPPERHDAIRARYPGAFDGPDEWVFHDHCFLVRTPSTLILFDTGIGGPETLGAQWFETNGRLPDELAEAGARTRAAWFDRVEEWSALLCTAHFPEPFGRLARDGGERIWSPAAGG